MLFATLRSLPKTKAKRHIASTVRNGCVLRRRKEENEDATEMREKIKKGAQKKRHRHKQDRDAEDNCAAGTLTQVPEKNW